MNHFLVRIKDLFTQLGTHKTHKIFYDTNPWHEMGKAGTNKMLFKEADISKLAKQISETIANEAKQH